MKKTLSLIFTFYFLLFANVYAQVSFSSWNINSVSSGGSISFSPGVTKSLSIAANLQKPNNQVVGDSYVYLSIRNSGGSEISRVQIQYVPTGFWSPGTGSNPVYYSLSNSINVLLSSAGTYRGYLLYVTSSNVEYYTSNYINFNAVAPISNNTISYSGTTSFVATGNPTNIIGSTPTGGTGFFTYQWQSSTTSASSGFSNISSAIALSYDPPTISQTTHYRRVVTSGGISSNSNVVTITINAFPPISNNSISNSGNSTLYGTSGDPSVLNGSTPTGGAGSGTYTYQWQSSTTSSSSGFSNIASATSVSYDPPPITDPPTIMQTTHFRRIVTSGGSSSNSNVITITLKPLGQNFENPIDLGTASGTSCQGFSSYLSYVDILYSDSYGTSAVDIYYKFTLLDAAEVEIGTCDEIHAFPLYLFDANQTLIEQVPFVNPYELGGCENGSLVHRSLPAGTYYLIASGQEAGTFIYSYALLAFININCHTYPLISNNAITNSGSSVLYGASADPAVLNGSTPIGGGGAGTYTYQWQSSNSSESWTFSHIPSATYSSYDPTLITQTTYYRRIVYSDFYSSTSNVIAITLDPLGSNLRTSPNSINYLLPESGSVMIYPNPAKEYIQFKIDENTSASAQIVSLNGIVLEEAQLTGTSDRMDVSNLASGLYLVRIIQNNRLYIKKLFVQK